MFVAYGDAGRTPVRSQARFRTYVCVESGRLLASRSSRGRLTTVSDTTAISQRQQRILEFIADTVRERGYPPTVREIGEAVGLTSSSSVHAQLANLERKGMLHKDPTKPRAMTLSEPRAGAVTVPVVGRIAAGSPLLAEEHIEDHIAMPEGYADDHDHFALTVTGDSMMGAGIFDGDLVI